MKYIFLVILVAMAGATFAKADGFRFERLDISYAGCIARNSVIIAYGTGGTMTLSYDDGAHWTRKPVAGDNERILKIANEANTFAGYTDLGKIIISTDNALTWKTLDLPSYLMPTADIIICNQQLCIAKGTSLYFLDQMLNIQDSITQSAGDSIVTLSYGNGVIYAGGNGGMLWIYDAVSHTRIRTIDLKEYGLLCRAPHPQISRLLATTHIYCSAAIYSEVQIPEQRGNQLLSLQDGSLWENRDFLCLLRKR
ncbi:hypothetical protein MASR2M18_04460 [Ignavibacteria bacterium]|jgi:hypothetical protein|nr:hypothetical protein [Bacteroidota bacterium]MCZ2131598.1 hypothetical protein [Bacteroidota bacterium]